MRWPLSKSKLDVSIYGAGALTLIEKLREVSTTKKRVVGIEPT